MADLIELYFKMIHDYNNYYGKVDVQRYWNSFVSIFLVGFIYFLCCELGTLIIFLINITTRISIPLNLMNYLYPIYIIVTILGLIPLTIRRLRDAEHEWTYLFWIFLPVVGWVFLVLALLESSSE